MRIKGKVRAVKPICASWLSVVLAGLLSLLATSAARADFYKSTFGGEIVEQEGIIPAPWDNVGIGSPFEVSYIFDSEAEDQHGSSHIGKYAIVSAEVIVDGVSQITYDGEIEIGLDEQLYLFTFQGLPIVADGHIGLWGSPGTFETDDLPLTLDLDDFASPQYFHVNGYYLDWWSAAGYIETFSSEVIPTPASTVPLAFGLFGRCMRRRVSRRRVSTHRGGGEGRRHQ